MWLYYLFSVSWGMTFLKMKGSSLSEILFQCKQSFYSWAGRFMYTFSVNEQCQKEDFKKEEEIRQFLVCQCMQHLKPC